MIERKKKDHKSLRMFRYIFWPTLGYVSHTLYKLSIDDRTHFVPL